MSPPKPAEMQVATAALRDDARVWAAQSDALGDVAARAVDLATTRLEAGMFQLLVDAYTDAQRHVAARCAEGRLAAAGVADTLRAVADTYDREEANHEHALRNLY